MPLKLDEQLLKIRIAAEEREAERRAAKAGVRYLDVATTPVKVEVLSLIPEEEARRMKVAAFELRKPDLALATYDPEGGVVQALVQKFTEEGYRPKLFAASLRGLEHLWSFYKFSVPDKAPITSRVNIERDRIAKLTAELMGLGNATKAIDAFDERTGSVTEFLEVVLSGALANRASDVHCEPAEKAVKVRYRIDGILHDVGTHLTPALYRSLVSRVKLLSNLKINVSDRPQDGRFTIGLAAKEIEIRIAIAPSEFGEVIVMRVLDPDVINLSLPELGLRPDDLGIIEVELARPNGMILNTGPTGSGKTSTLYAFLKAKANSEIKIITVEDPIEYHLPGIEQTQVDEEAGYTFANGLRSIMRQDPDAILVGEVRDRDTAEIAVQAALTGHLVFSTVHANEAAGAIPRLIDLGVKYQSIGPALNLVIGQRLVRRLCPKCKVVREVTPEERASIEEFLKRLPARVARDEFRDPKLFSPKGCPACSGTGYKGRIAVFELLLTKAEGGTAIKESFENLLGRGAGAAAIAEFAEAQGMVTMQQDGVLKAIQGVTTFEEVKETTGPIGWLK